MRARKEIEQTLEEALTGKPILKTLKYEMIAITTNETRSNNNEGKTMRIGGATKQRDHGKITQEPQGVDIRH